MGVTDEEPKLIVAPASGRQFRFEFGDDQSKSPNQDLEFIQIELGENTCRIKHIREAIDAHIDTAET